MVWGIQGGEEKRDSSFPLPLKKSVFLSPFSISGDTASVKNSHTV
jgi:hypothetical protein